MAAKDLDFLTLLNYRCERCEQLAPVTQNTFWGGYKARLCNPCINAWDTYLANTSLWQEVLAWNGRHWYLAGRAQIVTEEEWQAHRVHNHTLEQQARALAAAWVHPTGDGKEHSDDETRTRPV